MTLRLPKTQSLLTTQSFSDTLSFSVPEVPTGDLFPSPVQRLQSANRSVPQYILAKRERNRVTSPFLRCPAEVSYQIHLYLDGVDLMHTSHTCHAFLSFYSPKEWYGRYVSRSPSWSFGSLLDDRSDQGCLPLYKKSFTSEAFLRRRLGSPSPIALSSSSLQPLLLSSTPPSMASNVTGSTVEPMEISDLAPKDVEPMDICSAHKLQVSNDVQAPHSVFPAPEEEVEKVYLHEHDQTNMRVLLDEGKFYPSDAETESGHWNRVASPIYSTELKSKTTLAGSLVARQVVINNGRATSSVNAAAEQVFDFKVLLHSIPDLSQTVAVFTSDLWTAKQVDGTSWSSPFAPRDLPVVQLVELKHFPMVEPTLPGSKRGRPSHPKMRVLITLAFGQNVGEQDMLLLDVWRMIKVIEVFIPCISTSSRVPSFSSSPPSSSSCSSSSSVRTTGDVVIGRTETIKVSSNDDMRCRVVKIYSAIVPIQTAYDIQKRLMMSRFASVPMSSQECGSSVTTGLREIDMDDSLPGMSPDESNDHRADSAGVMGKCRLGTVKGSMVTIECIAIFGIQNSDTSSAMVARKILFTPRDRTVGLKRTLGDASWDKRTISRGVSCMTLFPCYSGYERLLVMFNRYGRGMIWDWVNERQVAQLRMSSDRGMKDGKITKQTSQAEDSSSSSQVTPSNGDSGSQTDEQASATASGSDEGASSVANPNRWLSYWGAQVSFTETPNPFEMDVTKNRSFRIVILADGRNDEWESTWWHVESSMGPMDHTIDQRLFVPIGARATISRNIGDAPVVYDIEKRYEDKTIGFEFISKKRQNQLLSKGQIATPLPPAPLRFNAYVVWNRYRISLTADRGLVMVDLERKGSKERNAKEQDSEWVTYLENSMGKTLVDIATVNNSLVVTLKDGHLVWSFFPVRTIPAEPEKVKEAAETQDTKVFTKMNIRRPTKRRKPHIPRGSLALDVEASAEANTADKKTKPSKSDTSREFKTQNARKRQSKRGTPRAFIHGERTNLKEDAGVDLFDGEMDSGPLGIEQYQQYHHY